MLNTPKKSIVSKPILYALLLAIGVFIGFELSNPNQSYIQKIDSEQTNTYGNGRVEELLRFIEAKYVDDVEADALIEVAMQNILGELDPHSSYLSPDQLKVVSQQMTGHYKGIGIETINDDDTLVVVNIIPESPASQSSLKLFDRIVKIDGESPNDSKIDDKLIDNSSNLEKANKIQLTIVRKSSEEELDLNLDIENVNVPSTNLAMLIQDSIAFVKIKQFNSKVYKDFNFALEKIDPEKLKHLIVDLRGNPGGYLPETAKILSLFFTEKNKMLVYTKDRNDRVAEYKSNGTNFYNFEKIAIIVDAGSASGSEIMAGAIQDWDRGVIIGQATYGKGLVQEQYNLKNGGALRLTVARYFTPSGRFIQKSYKQQAEIDSTQYYSLLYNRPLDNEGGIVPDIIIDIPRSCPRLFDEGPAFIAFKMLKHKQWFPEDVDVNPDMILKLSGKDIYATINKNEDTELNETDPCINDFMRRVKYQMIKLLFNEQIALAETIGIDPYMKEAIQSISRKELFATSSNNRSTSNK